jgi:stress-induced morphogen
MPMTESEITRLIKDAMPDAYIELKDLRGDGDHFQAYVESRSFIGKTRVQQHQMVYAALQGRVGGVLHALTLSTAIPQKG